MIELGADLTEKVFRIASLDDALRAIKLLTDHNPAEIIESVVFANTFPGMRVKITGPAYHASLPTATMWGFSEFQQSLNRAVALVRFGRDDGRVLGYASDSFELVFKIEEGSTDLLADLSALLNGVTEGFKTMDSKHKLIAAIFLGVLLVTGYTAGKLLDNITEEKKQEIEAQINDSDNNALISTAQIVAGLAANNKQNDLVQQHLQEGTKAIVKGAEGADEIQIGRVTLDRPMIREITQRSSREPKTAEVRIADYSVVRVESRDMSITRFALADGKAEFIAIVDNAEMSAEDMHAICDAAENRRAITLEVSLTLSKGVIKNAQIVSVVRPQT